MRTIVWIGFISLLVLPLNLQAAIVTHRATSIFASGNTFPSTTIPGGSPGTVTVTIKDDKPAFEISEAPPKPTKPAGKKGPKEPALVE